MGIFSSNKNSLSSREIDRALAELGILEGSDKDKIKSMLRRRRAGGITKGDVIDVTRRLKSDTSDSVDRSEANAARRKLIDELDNK